MSEFLQDLIAVVQAGGSLMLALAGLAFFLYWIAIDTLSKLPRASGTGEEPLTEQIMLAGIDEFRADQLQFLRGRRSLLQVLTTTAPLLGLLGTVMGMLTTFRGLTQSEGDVFDQVAAGISEAMITTETGLVISIPALFLLMFVDSRIKQIEHELLKLDKAKG
ncbi:MAG: MotA/TolQ/ExbB proton channel family protein [Pseudomonadales bacterium]|nr:MotA/TolQ/ExbB proton channel family protein [Pseudomonadales bacterium]